MQEDIVEQLEHLQTTTVFDPSPRLPVVAFPELILWLLLLLRLLGLLGHLR
jgi:hypothetical protein